MNRKRLLGFLTGTILFAGTLTTSMILSNDFANISYIQNIDNKETTAVSNNGYMEGVDKIVDSSTYGVPLSGNNDWSPNKNTNYNSSLTAAVDNDIVTVANSTTNTGLMRIDGTTGEIKWVCNFPSPMKVYHILYMNNTNTLLVLTSQSDDGDKNVRLNSINPDDGTYKDNASGFSGVNMTFSAGTRDTCFVQPVLGANDCVIVGNRDTMTNTQRKGSIFKVWIDTSDGTCKNAQKMDYVNDNTENPSTLLSMVSAWWNNRTYVFELLRYHSSKLVFLKVWTWTTTETKPDDGYNQSIEKDYGSFMNNTLVPNDALNYINPTIYPLMWDESSTKNKFAVAAFVQNANDESYNYNHTKLLWMTGDNNTTDNSGVVNLDGGEHDYDIYAMDYSYDFNVMQFAKMATGINSDGKIVQFKMGEWYLGNLFTNDDSWVWSGQNNANDRVRIYDFMPNVGKQKAKISSAVQLTNGNIAWMQLDGTRSLWQIKTPGLGTWAYNSYLTESSIAIPGGTNESAYWVNDRNLKEYAKRAGALSKLNYRSSTSEITSVTKSSTITNAQVYRGEGSFDVNVSNVFVNGQKQDSSTFKFTISGFHQYETNVVGSSKDIRTVDSLKAYLPSTVPNEAIINYLMDANTGILFDLPIGFDKRNLRIENPVNKDNSGSKQFDIVLQEYVDSNHVLKTDGGFRTTFTLTGFKVQDTGINPVVQASSLFPNKSYTPADITKQLVTDAIASHPEVVFTNVPEHISTSDISEVKITDIAQASGSINVSFKFRNSVPADAILSFQIAGLNKTITGYKKDTITVSNTNLSSQAISENQLKDIIRQNINNMLTGTPPNYNPTNEQITLSGLNRDPSGSSLTVNVTFKKVYTNAGFGEFSHTYTFNGFNGTVTKIKTTVPLGDKNKVATDSSITTETIKQLVENNINEFATGLPNGYKPQNKVTIGPLDRNLSKGTISFQLTLKEVYGNNNSASDKVTITGYRTTGLTTTISENPVIDNSNTLPSDLSIEDIKQQIIDNNWISGLPDNQKISPNDLDVSIVSYDNATGKVVVNVSLTNGGWVNGNRQPINFGEITIGGYLTKSTNSTSWWVWVAIATAIILLILLIILIILLIKKKKVEKQRLATIAPLRPVNQIETTVVHHNHLPNQQHQSTTTTRRVVQHSSSNNHQIPVHGNAQPRSNMARNASSNQTSRSNMAKNGGRR